MKLFRWPHSETLKNYACGDIIVMAEDLEQARRIAYDEFVKWVHTPETNKNWIVWLYGTDHWSEDDEEEYQTLLSKFRDDISKGPIDNEVAFFISGSE